MRIKIMTRALAMIALIVLCVPVAQAGHGQGNAPSPPPGAIFMMTCRVVDGESLGFLASVTDGYGQRNVKIGAGRLLCSAVAPDQAGNLQLQITPPAPNPEPVADANAVRCYSLSNNTSAPNQGGPAPTPEPALITDGWHQEQDVSVGNPAYLCVPAFVEPPPQPPQ